MSVLVFIVSYTLLPLNHIIHICSFEALQITGTFKEEMRSIREI